MLALLAPAALLIAGASDGVLGEQQSRACVSLDGQTTVVGKLSFRTVPLDYGKADGTTGTMEHPVYMVDAEGCFVDEDGQVQFFEQVHVYTDLGDIEELLKRAVGKRVQLTGEAFPGFTRYHMAPLVLEVSGFATLDPADMDDPLAH